MGAIDLIFITLSHNVSFVGKTWWLSMLVSRAPLVLLSGFSLFGDDQGGFICDTLQPGCSSVCFDAFAPVCVFHLWLLHCVLLCLPHVLFAAYVSHKVLSDPALGGRGASAFTLETSGSSGALSLHEARLNKLPRGRATPRFCCAYVLTVVLRILLEALFGAGQLFIFGLSVPKSFLCSEAPCTSGVECYVSKPTEKTLMLNFMLGISSMSVLLSLADLASAVKAMGRWRMKRATVTQEVGNGEQSSVFTATGAAEGVDVALTRRIRPSGSSNVAANNGNPATATSTTVPAHVNPHSHPRGAPLDPGGPPSTGVKILKGPSSPGAANSGQESANVGPQDKKAWV